MRTRTLKKTVQKQVKKEVEKSIKTLINEFNTNKKGLIEVFGLVSTQSFNIIKEVLHIFLSFPPRTNHTKLCHNKLLVKYGLSSLHQRIMIKILIK